MGPFSRPSSERVSGPEKGKRNKITRKAGAFGELRVLANITLYHSILHYIIDYNTYIYIYIYMYMLTLLVTHFSSPISGPPKEGRPRPALELEARARLQSVSIISIFKFSI